LVLVFFWWFGLATFVSFRIDLLSFGKDYFGKLWLGLVWFGLFWAHLVHADPKTTAVMHTFRRVKNKLDKKI
jgi:hypothetical protein